MSVKDFLKSKSFFINLGLIVISFFVIILLIFFSLKIYTRHGKEYIVPDISGRLIQEIEQMEEMSPFNIVIIDSIFQEETPSGTILSQEPVANSKAKKGRKIYLTIASFSGDDIDMPSCVDMSLKLAVQTLTDVGLRIGNISFVQGNISNIVVAQQKNGKQIRQNTKVKRGEVIDLVVEMTESQTTTNMPDILGKTEEDAEKMLWAAGLNVGKKEFEGKKEKYHSRVVSYQPTFQGLTLGTTVSLYFVNDTKNNYKKLKRDFEEQLILEQSQFEEWEEVIE
ncbi:MAG: PASTA domain-containing protein [Bacteroidales bacterium]|jgi:beta-lactam-binding protein with PASTA domain|nr:PASTA domain-containing protein [Bacteroidales bacterium]